MKDFKMYLRAERQFKKEPCEETAFNILMIILMLKKSILNLKLKNELRINYITTLASSFVGSKGFNL